jgi:hypothetical protein
MSPNFQPTIIAPNLQRTDTGRSAGITGVTIMLALLKMLDERLSEPSTYAGLSAVLLALNVNIDPGIWHQVTLYGTGGAGIGAMLLSEIGNKPPMQVAVDVMRALAVGLKTIAPDATAKPVAAETTASATASAASAPVAPTAA